MVLYVDFETRNVGGIKGKFSHQYASDPTTEVMCLGYAFDKEEPQLALWGELPEEVNNHVLNGGEVRAFNATFEFSIWNLVCAVKYGWPPLALDQLTCIAAHARYSRVIVDTTKGSTFAALNDVCRFLGLPLKDEAGAEALKKLYSPISVGDEIVWYEGEEEFAAMLEYCKQDIRLLPMIESRLPPFPPSEKELWRLNERLNNTGVHINTDLCRGALDRWEKMRIEADWELAQLTTGEVTKPTQNSRILQYLNRVEGREETSLTAYKEEDIQDPTAKRVMRLRSSFAKSVMGKYQKFLAVTDSDSRYRGAHIYYGAGTGRMAGYGAQLQNLMSPLVEEDQIPPARNWLLYPDLIAPPSEPEKAVPSCIRSVVEATPGKVLVSMDSSGIENRVLPWLAGAEQKLQMIRDGVGLYELMGAQIFGVPVTEVTAKSFYRKVGKIGELSLGFQGGDGALAKAEKKEKIVLPPDLRKTIIQTFRKADYNLPIVAFWRALHEAAVKAVLNPGVWFNAGEKIAYMRKNMWLICRLPSVINGNRRYLFYPYPKVVSQSFYKMLNDEGEEICRSFFDDPGPPWELASKGKVVTFSILTRAGRMRKALYGGFAAENVTQAVAGDIVIREALPKVAASKIMTALFTVHDEINAETDHPDEAYKELHEILTTPPSWAPDLPLAAQGWISPYFKK